MDPGLRRLPGLTAIAAATVLSATWSYGMTVTGATTTREGNTYRSSVTATVDSPAASVAAVLADFQHYRDLNPEIRETEILPAQEPGHVRVRFLYQPCILIFCRSLRYVVDFRVSASEAQGTIVPEGSDFRSGSLGWRVENQGGHSLVYTDAVFEPAFWLPPLIGPFLIQRKLRRDGQHTLDIVEQRAREQAP